MDQSTLKRDMDAMNKAHETEVKGLKNRCADQEYQVKQLKQDIGTSHANKTAMQTRAEDAKQRVQPVSK